MFAPHIDDMVQDGYMRPAATRARVVNDILKPINRRMEVIDENLATRGQGTYSRQQKVRSVMHDGISQLNRLAPNEWNHLKARLQAMREEEPPLAHDRHHITAPYSMFRRSDLEADDPEAREDAPEALGGDRRMPQTGLRTGDNMPQVLRFEDREDPVIALTRGAPEPR